jgi:hypothetical protein
MGPDADRLAMGSLGFLEETPQPLTGAIWPLE